jgi:hypothetical protein
MQGLFNENLEHPERINKTKKLSRPAQFVIAAGLFILLAVVGIYLFNYIRLQSRMNEAIKGDERNIGINVSVHYGSYVNTSTLICDLKPLPTGKNLSDAFRVLWSFSGKVSFDSFTKDELSYNDKSTTGVLKPQIELQRVMQKNLEGDPRNKGIEALVYFSNLNDPSTLVFDLQKVSGTNSMTDVFRVLLQFAENIQTKKFERVELAYLGRTKFKLDGGYFQQIGQERSWQNPVYTIRTFPENLKNPDGSRAYPEWTGGWLGITGKQFEDVNDFHRKWYVEEMLKQK